MSVSLNIGMQMFYGSFGWECSWKQEKGSAGFWETKRKEVKRNEKKFFEDRRHTYGSGNDGGSADNGEGG